jgi:transcriptional regulator with XRE-family HTH domain
VEAATIPAARFVRPITRALNEARAAGIPAYAIARAADVSPGLLSRISSGQLPATPATAEAIAGALGRPRRELFPEV